MADEWQLALLKRSVKEWNAWREANPDETVDLRDADLSGANLSYVYLHYANLSYSKLINTDLSLTKLSNANIRFANLSNTNLNGADLSYVSRRNADFTNAKGLNSLSQSTTPKSHPNKSSTSPTDWLSLVTTVGNTLLVTTASIASIIQGLDVVERRWREHKEQQQGGASTQHASSPSSKKPQSDSDIADILLLMEDGSHQEQKQWVSDPDVLRRHIEAFSDPTSKGEAAQCRLQEAQGPRAVGQYHRGRKRQPATQGHA